MTPQERAKRLTDAEYTIKEIYNNLVNNEARKHDYYLEMVFAYVKAYVETYHLDVQKPKE